MTLSPAVGQTLTEPGNGLPWPSLTWQFVANYESNGAALGFCVGNSLSQGLIACWKHRCVHPPEYCIQDGVGDLGRWGTIPSGMKEPNRT